MPMDCPWYRPEPKSACNGVVDPMKVMIVSEFGSSGALAMFVFQRLLDGKGMNPFKLAPCPRLIRLQGLICADTRPMASDSVTADNRHFRNFSPIAVLLPVASAAYQEPNGVITRVVERIERSPGVWYLQ